MNKTYRSVWNAVTNTWTAAAETAKAHSKGSARAARQAVIAIALGGAAIGGAAAAEACTTEDGSSGTVDAAGVCKAAGDGAIGMMGTVGTMATDDTTFVKVNATANPASATGANAIAIGQTVTSAGSSSVAIGSNTTASGLHSVALGAGAKNADASDRQIAIGGQAQTAGKYTIAMGYLASATVEDALAFGRASSATSTGAVAIGAAATSGGTGSTAIGQSAAVVSSATNAVALGMNARVANSYSAAIGSNASAAGNYSSALGTSATSTGTASMALGGNSTATGNYSVAIGSATGMGRAAVATGTSSVAIGTTSSAGANNAVALGFGTVADRDNTVSVGAGVPNIDGNKFTRQIVNVAAGTEDNDAVNVGQMKTALSTKVDDTYVKIDTSNSTAAAQAGTAALAIGTNTSASGSYATAVGNSARASGNNSTALGFQASSAGGAAVAVGNGANASGSHGVALGVNAGASHTDSVALGASSVTDRDNSVSVGSSTLRRQITNVAAGTADTDAVNVAQMNAGLSTTNAAIAATNLNVSSLSTGLSSTNSTVAGLSTGLSSTNSTVAGLSTGLSSTNSTVAGLSTDLSTTNSTVAGLGTDLSTTNSTVAGLSTGLSSTNSTVAGLSTGLSSTVSTVAGHTKQIGDIDDKLSKLESGTTGLVQQANPGDDITVGANTDGNAVDFSSKTGARTLKGVAAGDVSATSTEAVNGSQLHGVSDSVASAIGGGATVNPDGSISAPVFTVGDGSGGTKIVNSVGEVVTNLDGRVTTNEGDIKKLADDIGSGTLGLVQQAKPGDDITVGANTDGNAVDFSSKTGARTLKGVAAGDVSATSTEAINGSQLHGVSDSVASAIGGGATVNPDGSISAPSFTVGDGSGGTKVVNSVGEVVTNLDGRVTTNEGDIKKLADDIGSGTLGLVRQAKPGDDITVGANTDGNAVDFSSKTGARTLKGVAAGDVSATSTEAVNGSQLHGVSDSVASAIGGGAAVNPDGSISAPSFTVGDGSGGTKIVNSVGDVVTNLDGRTTTNEGDIKKLADDIGSGTLGLVQQAKPGDDITVGANTDGNAVDFSSKTGVRTLKGIAAGDVSATSTEAVNGSQLHGVSDSVASAIGGGAAVNPDGSISAPVFTVGDGSGGTKIVNSVGDVVTNLDGRVTTNEGGLKKLSEQLESGTLGLVQQDAMTGGITVGANTGGSVVNFAGTGGARVLSGVANGVDDDDVVTVSQLRATGLIDYTGKEVGAVTYDSGLNFDTVTFAGTFGTKLQRVAAGEISATSMDAINGSQLFDLQEQFAKQYGELSGQFGDLSNRFDDLSDRLGELETNPGTGGPGTGDGSTVVGEGAVASGENSSALGEKALASGENSSAVGQGAVASGSNGSAIGQGSTASGSNSSAVGQGAVASGNNGSAVGQGAVASGENGTALGQGAVASGKDSTALGQGASATGSGSVAIGQGSVATEANTVSFGDGTAEGNRRLVNIADGINASDAATKGQLDRAMESVDQRFNDTNRAINDVAKNAYAGIAAAMAMPNMTPSQPGKTVVAVGAANFKSGSAIAAGATYRSRSGNWLVNGATSITSVGDVGVRAQVGYEF
ncbi:ESPR-type extended signal peptide-containing protein [Burkholderia cenocepacia]|uniref:ESPR-type extended signal peptide-containing protein n=13 Tax=Burkholderia cenocepacia TaxID=95486 RepID=UPI000F5B8214|nr:ESPR-type extended signal peptide-containing protein [Burkholderia cenocepacia]MCW3503081.1 YadA-like family protein [Burkholderia cenocepacia]MCW3510724.1 YadA-like family protein [Burkholderia cenocepacia]MCW3518091.1 YadA-like family protein [Burkholderia cenocepacia]MCW3533434.1 YadA-like family protein [Burkholderia cenocepacia]MCW3548699.1 YadA-like family protein [Burkholderia cenocepacia]